jgi:membrane protease YdiL (CAAX protease family)
MITSLLESLLHILIVLPFILWGRAKNRSSDIKPVIYFILIYLATNLIITAFSHTILFDKQQWNWAGKAAALVFGLLLLNVIPGFKPRDFGWRAKMDWAGTRPLLIVCFIYLLARIALYMTSGEADYSIKGETLLYQATLPGIQEELIFRGILLGLLSAVFIRPAMRFLNVDFGLAAIITSILFGLAHGLSLSKDFDIAINAVAFGRSAIDGFLYALLLQKTKSLIPGIVFHNLLNVIGDH